MKESIPRKINETKQEEIKTGKILQSIIDKKCVECGAEIERGILCEVCEEDQWA